MQADEGEEEKEGTEKRKGRKMQERTKDRRKREHSNLSDIHIKKKKMSTISNNIISIKNT